MFGFYLAPDTLFLAVILAAAPWFIKLRELSLINMRPQSGISLTVFMSWQITPGRGLHHNSYSRALTAVVVVTGCRCGPQCPVTAQWASDSRDLTLTPVTSPQWAPHCDSDVLLMASDAQYALVITPHDNAGDYEASVKVTRAQSANTGPSSAL